MSGVLVLDRQMVYGDLDRLRNAIASHTESEETAAELVAEITVARAFGAIAYVTLLPSALRWICMLDVLPGGERSGGVQDSRADVVAVAR